MKVLTWLGAVLACLVALPACTSPQLDTGPNHPASSEAVAAPLTPVGSALEKTFEPQAAATPAGAAAPAGAAPGGAEHQHGAAASGAAPAPAPAAHAEHRHEPAAEKKAPPAATEWTCPMHPEIIRNEPGSCPICGMKLKPVPPQGDVQGAP